MPSSFVSGDDVRSHIISELGAEHLKPGRSCASIVNVYQGSRFGFRMSFKIPQMAHHDFS